MSHKRRSHKKRLYRKRREIRLVPGSKSIPLFSTPETKKNTPILDHNDFHKEQGGIVQGLRSYLNKKDV